jgi:hypothetical protein
MLKLIVVYSMLCILQQNNVFGFDHIIYFSTLLRKSMKNFTIVGDHSNSDHSRITPRVGKSFRKLDSLVVVAHQIWIMEISYLLS